MTKPNDFEKSSDRQATNLALGSDGGTIPPILKALRFAAERHSRQRRKDRDASPYVNHLIDIAHILCCVAGVTDLVTLQGAILHDTIEDTFTTPDELQDVFGREVRLLVEEVTDDKRLPKAERKQLQILHAHRLSIPAKLIKIADKISNVRDVTHAPPTDWTVKRRREYLDWTEQVVAGCRGCNKVLEALYENTLELGRQILTRQTDQS
jgi:(p)ppGpp synthase/HD superfamily hydrolase